MEKCSLSGTVVNSVTGEPLDKVEVVLEDVEHSRRIAAAVTTSDSEGHFSMVGLDPGAFHLTGNRNGYLETAYGARRPESGGAVMRLEPGQSLPNLKLKLLPFGVIAGAVRVVVSSVSPGQMSSPPGAVCRRRGPPSS